MSERIQSLESGGQDRGEAQDSAMADLAKSLFTAFEKNGAAARMDTQLQALSSATGEAVSKIYEFQRGLEAVGERDEYLPGIFAHAQSALSGAGEKGSAADAAFAQLGLKADFLRGKDMADVILRIADALDRLKPDQAAAIAQQLFGRGAANSVLQIGRNLDLFRWEMSKASATGALLEKYSKTFQGMNASRNDLEGDVLGIQAAITGKNAPEIQKVYTIIHDDIKNLGPAIAGGVPSPEDALNRALNQLKTDLAPFTATMPKSAHDRASNTHAADPGLDSERSHYRPEFTSLEKMGFIMSGSRVQNPMDLRKVDLLEQIARNTASIQPNPTSTHPTNSL